MSELALVLLAVLLPTLVMGTGLLAIRVFRRLSEARCRPQPPEPADRIAARLRRLRGELEAMENQPVATAKRHHILALRGAYLDTLGQACRRFGIEAPAGGDRARQAEIYRVEAALRERGLDVRETAVR